MNKETLEIIGLIVAPITGLIAILGAFSKLFSKRRETVQKKEKWVTDVCNNVRTISQAMGIGQMDYVLNIVYDYIHGKSALFGNPSNSLFENNKVIAKAKAEIEGLLNNSSVPKAVIESFREKMETALSEYRICRDDLGVIIDLCEVVDYANVKAIVSEAGDKISDELREAIEASCNSSRSFKCADFLSDVMGIRFVDGQIPDYSVKMNSLISWLQETVLSNSINLSEDNDRRYKRHASPESLYEKAEKQFDEKNYKNAIKWYQQASNRGSGEASFKLGECYERGIGCSQNLEKAADSYLTAAGQGLAIAMYRIGKCYEEGRGRERNLADAVYYYEQSAQKGFAEALFRMGLCYWRGEFRNIDKRKARRFIEDAAKRGHIDAQRSLSALKYLDGDIDSSMKWAKSAAENGDVEGMGYYGYWLMYKGADKSEYLFWLKKSAEGGCVISQFNLGLFYLGENDLGLYCEGDADACPITDAIPKAYKWFKKAATSGDAASQFVMGMLELRNNKDRKAPEEWFLRSLGNGFSWAHFGLGIIKDRDIHYSEAREHFEVAWDAGNPSSWRYLTYYYSHGVIGVGQDKELASFYQNAKRMLACEWFLSDPKNLSADPLSWYVPPFDRQFYDNPSDDSTTERVVRSSMLTFMRKN